MKRLFIVLFCLSLLGCFSKTSTKESNPELYRIDTSTPSIIVSKHEPDWWHYKHRFILANGINRETKVYVDTLVFQAFDVGDIYTDNEAEKRIQKIISNKLDAYHKEDL